MPSDYITVTVRGGNGVVTVDQNPAEVNTLSEPHNVTWQFIAPTNATSVTISWASSSPPFDQTTQPTPPLGPWQTAQPTKDPGDFTYHVQFFQNGKPLIGGDFIVRKKPE